MTTSFRDARIDWSRVAMVAALVKVCTQRQIAEILDVSVNIVSKCVRINEANK